MYRKCHTAEWLADENAEKLKNSAFGDCLTVEGKIAGVKTKCLFDTGSEVSTISESHFRQHFGEQKLKLSSACWVKLTAANRLDIPLLGCLQTDVECLRKVLPRKCIFVLTDTIPDVKEMKGMSGIIGMNILNEIQSLFISAEGIEKVDKYSQ